MDVLKRPLILAPLVIALIAILAITVTVTMQRRDHGPVWTTETYTMNETVDPPQWMKTVEKVALPALKEDGTPNKSGHTTKVILPGSKVAYINFENVGIKPDASVKLTVNGNGGSVPANTYLIVDKVVINNLDAIKTTFLDSEYVKVVLTDLEADGASLHHSVQKVTSYPPFSDQEWDGLPGLDLKNIKTDEIIVEAVTTNAKVGTLTFKNVRAPVQVEIKRIKGNELSVTGSSFGDGDNDSATQALVLSDTVKQGSFSETNIKADVKVDNR